MTFHESLQRIHVKYNYLSFKYWWMEVLLNQSAWIGKYLKWALKNSVRTKQFHGKVTWKNWFFCGFGLLKFFVTKVSHAHTHLTRSSAFCRKLLTWGHFDYDNFKVDFLKKNIKIGRTEKIIHCKIILKFVWIWNMRVALRLGAKF